MLFCVCAQDLFIARRKDQPCAPSDVTDPAELVPPPEELPEELVPPAQPVHVLLDVAGDGRMRTSTQTRLLDSVQRVLSSCISRALASRKKTQFVVGELRIRRRIVECEFDALSNHVLGLRGFARRVGTRGCHSVLELHDVQTFGATLGDVSRCCLELNGGLLYVGPHLVVIKLFPLEQFLWHDIPFESVRARATGTLEFSVERDAIVAPLKVILVDRVRTLLCVVLKFGVVLRVPVQQLSDLFSIRPAVVAYERPSFVSVAMEEWNRSWALEAGLCDQSLRREMSEDVSVSSKVMFLLGMSLAEMNSLLSLV